MSGYLALALLLAFAAVILIVIQNRAHQQHLESMSPDELKAFKAAEEEDLRIW
jgi:hypothetical protein